MSLQMRDVMVEKIITTTKEATIEDAVNLMNKHEIGCLVAVENGKPVGIITERDLLKRVLAKSKEIRNMKVSEIMSTPIISVDPAMEIEEATKLMLQKKIKKLPTVEKGNLLGLVTLTDILRIHPQLIKMYKIFSSDLAPRRMKKVFDYYLLLQTEFKTADIPNLRNLELRKI